MTMERLEFFGLYFGEIIIRNLGGSWVRGQELPADSKYVQRHPFCRGLRGGYINPTELIYRIYRRSVAPRLITVFRYLYDECKKHRK